MAVQTVAIAETTELAAILRPPISSAMLQTVTSSTVGTDLILVMCLSKWSAEFEVVTSLLTSDGYKRWRATGCRAPHLYRDLRQRATSRQLSREGKGSAGIA